MARSKKSLRRCRVSGQLFVIARNSSFAYKGRAVDVKQVGKELGSATSSKAVSEKQAAGSALPVSSLTPPPEPICGQTVLTAAWRTFSTFRTK